MVLNSYSFLSFLFLAAVLYHLLPGRCRPWLLLVCSYVFYCSWNTAYAIILAMMSLASYGSGLLLIRLHPGRARRWCFWGSLAVLVGILAFFKYLKTCQTWLIPYLNPDWNITGNLTLELIVPIGISFYTFKMISYLADVYLERGEAVRDPVLLCAHFAFFPYIVSGPIQRTDDFTEQVTHPDLLESRLVLDGMLLIALGFLKKLVADQLAPLLEPMFNAPAHFRGLPCLVGAYLFTAQLYLDFSGYTDVAVGAGKLFGIRCPNNFLAPLLACNIQEFWKRWHSTLTAWLKDYVFIPLNLSLRFLGSVGTIAAVTLNMLLIGIWHDFKTTFVIFGLLHALYISLFLLTAPVRKRAIGHMPLAGALGWLVTVHLVVLTFLVFRAPSWSTAQVLLGNLFIANVDTGVLQVARALLILAAVAVLLGHLIESGRLRFPRSESACYALLSAAMVVLYIYAPVQPVSFLYQKF